MVLAVERHAGALGQHSERTVLKASEYLFRSLRAEFCKLKNCPLLLGPRFNPAKIAYGQARPGKSVQDGQEWPFHRKCVFHLS